MGIKARIAAIEASLQALTKQLAAVKAEDDGLELVIIRQFRHGNQGTVHVLGRVYLKVYDAEGTYPQKDGCAERPLVAIPYHWVALGDHRWPVRRSTHKRDEGHWSLYVAADAPINRNALNFVEE